LFWHGVKRKYFGIGNEISKLRKGNEFLASVSFLLASLEICSTISLRRCRSFQLFIGGAVAKDDPEEA